MDDTTVYGGCLFFLQRPRENKKKEKSCWRQAHDAGMCRRHLGRGACTDLCNGEIGRWGRQGIFCTSHTAGTALFVKKVGAAFALLLPGAGKVISRKICARTKFQSEVDRARGTAPPIAAVAVVAPWAAAAARGPPGENISRPRPKYR